MVCQHRVVCSIARHYCSSCSNSGNVRAYRIKYTFHLKFYTNWNLHFVGELLKRSSREGYLGESKIYQSKSDYC